MKPAPVVFITAMAQESAALLRHVDHWKRLDPRSAHLYSFEIGGQECLLATSGMGARRAAESAQFLVGQYSPRLIVSFGIAGAAGPELDIGDVVLVEAVCTFERNAVSDVQPLLPWPARSREAVAQAMALRSRQIWSGTAVSTRGPQPGERQLAGLFHPVLEMETAAIARVAGVSGVPLASLRAISDGPRAPVPVNLGEVMDDDANLRPLQLVKTVLLHPLILLQARRMLHNAAVAAKHAALAMLAATGNGLLSFPSED